MAGPAKIASYVGVGMVLAGFALIFFAWDGAAELDLIQGQFPFMISGGLGGVGLIVSGMALLLVQAQRATAANRAREFARLQAALDRLATLLPDAGAAREAAPPATPRATTETGAPRPGRVQGGPPAGGYVPRPRSAPVARGRVSPQADERATAVLGDDDLWAPPHDDAEEPDAGSAADEADRISASLEGVRGIGPAKQRRIAEHVGTHDRLVAAGVEELAAIPGISEALAKRIHAHLRQ